jgi:hypothetical protein
MARKLSNLSLNDDGIGTLAFALPIVQSKKLKKKCCKKFKKGKRCKRCPAHAKQK